MKTRVGHPEADRSMHTVRRGWRLLGQALRVGKQGIPTRLADALRWDSGVVLIPAGYFPPTRISAEVRQPWQVFF